MEKIILKNVRQGNLKNISLEIPKNKFVLLTGVSGSGKSTLAMDVIFQECQRQYLEAMGMQGIRKPDLESMKNAAAAICVTPKDVYKNPRSTVGTISDIYTDLRMLYEKLSVRECPYCHNMIGSADCKEEVVKDGDDLIVYMYCPYCKKKMEKFTRTHFSYNTREGACPTCQGLGEVRQIHRSKVLNEELSLEDGAIDYWKHRYKDYQIENYYLALNACHISIPKNIKLKDFSKEQMAILWEGSEANKQLYPNEMVPKQVSQGRFEGVQPYLWSRLAKKEGNSNLEEYFHKEECFSCHGEKLKEEVRSLTIKGVRLAQLSKYPLEKLLDWICGLDAQLNEIEHLLCDNYILDLKTKLNRLIQVGLGYLHLDRAMMTLSAGEAQRLKLSSVLASQMSGLLYILDEPTAGLHPQDTKGLIAVLQNLRDLGNSILVIEHDEDMIREADYIIDLGLRSGKHGGEVCVQGSVNDVISCERSLTGNYLKHPSKPKKEIREGKGSFRIHNACKHNLKNLKVTFPTEVLCGICGVSGSGKSTLIFDVLAEQDQNIVQGISQFDEIIAIDQVPPIRMKRSNVATYCDVYTPIRNLFAKVSLAKECQFTSAYFSFNTKGGRCERCEGMGTISSNLLFFEDVQVPCPVCKGKRFIEEVLEVKWNGYSISEILHFSVEEALLLFQDEKEIAKILTLLQEAGLSYLELGQSLTTLSQGEAQRCKLVKELIKKRGKHSLYLLDEPTNGLHPDDIKNFLILLNKLVDQGNTVIVVEHNEILLRECDYLMELGPQGGIHGGKIMAQGYLSEFLDDPNALTSTYLK